MRLVSIYIWEKVADLFKTVALGYSKFCEVFTEDEWEGFNYAFVLFGSLSYGL